MAEYNILILSGGRRVELIKEFKKAALELNIQSNVIAGDCSTTAPALYFADRQVILPRIEAPNYIDEIIDICTREKISLVVPTIDTDLLPLSREKKRIEEESGARVLISDESVVSICRDKIRTQKFFEENLFKMPKLYSKKELDHEDLQYPLFIKPKSGSSSINAFKVNNKKELSIYRELINDYMIQDYIEGEEYTIDAFLDFASNIITVVPRLRLAVRSGEILKGKIVKDREIIEEVKKVLSILQPIGHVTLQLMKTAQGIEFIEINPRFGGGAPMSIQSGANSCKNLYGLLTGKQLSYNEDYRDNLTFLRFDDSICLDEDMRIVKW